MEIQFKPVVGNEPLASMIYQPTCEWHMHFGTVELLVFQNFS